MKDFLLLLLRLSFTALFIHSLMEHNGRIHEYQVLGMLCLSLLGILHSTPIISGVELLWLYDQADRYNRIQLGKQSSGRHHQYVDTCNRLQATDDLATVHNSPHSIQSEYHFHFVAEIKKVTAQRNRWADDTVDYNDHCPRGMTECLPVTTTIIRWCCSMLWTLVTCWYKPGVCNLCNFRNAGVSLVVKHFYWKHGKQLVWHHHSGISSDRTRL